MLYTQTVAPRTLELLKKLEAEPSLAAFNLAGGTALALYLGHRSGFIFPAVFRCQEACNPFSG